MRQLVYSWTVMHAGDLQTLAVEANDVGKVVYVVNDNIFHTLINHQYPPMWAPVAAGGEDMSQFVALKHTQLDWLQMWKDEFHDGIFTGDKNRLYNVTPPCYKTHYVSAKHVRYSSEYNHSLYGPYLYDMDGSFHKAQYKVLGHVCTEEQFLLMYWARRFGNKEKLEELVGMFIAINSKEII